MAQPQDVKTAVTTVPATRPASSTIKSIINMPAIQQKFNAMLGEKKAAGFLSSIISATEGSSALRECDPMNVISQAAVAASLDLPINPSLGFAHLVPYSGVCQFQMGWRGYVQLGMRTGEYRSMNCSEVYEDEIEHWNPITGEFKFADPKTWKHRYEGNASKIAGYVASFKLLNGFEKFLYMTRNQCIAHGKKYSKSFQKGKGKWADDPHVMCLKTVIKLLLSKWAPLSIEMMRAVRLDQASVQEDGEPQYVDLPDATEGRIDIEDTELKADAAVVVAEHQGEKKQEGDGIPVGLDWKPIKF